MTERPLMQQVTDALRETNAVGGYPTCLVCTEQGLLVASAGAGVDEEIVAGFTSLFADIVNRAQRDLHFGAVDEVTLLDPTWGRTVIRPIDLGGDVSMFLVVRVAGRGTSWRRNTNRLCRQLSDLLGAWVDPEGDLA